MSAFRVAVLAGGPSSEAAVSRVSAAAVAHALREAGHVVSVLELDRQLAAALVGGAFEVVFPALHGPLGEDGCVQGLLEVLDLPYVGSGVLASALAASKPHAKAQFRKASLPLAPDAVVQVGEDLVERAASLRAELGPALIVKPASGGSAIGVGRVRADASTSELVAALERALEIDRTVLVESFVTGLEVTCGVLELASGARALPPTLITAQAADWYDFQSRYASGGSVHTCPAPFSPALTEQIQNAAVGAHRALGARDLSRVDFVVAPDDAARPVTVLELNTLPGMTPTSLFPEAAGVAGMHFVALCDALVRQAQARPPRLVPREQPMPG